MSLTLSIHPEASQEFLEAYDWFESRWPDRGERFAAALNDVYRRILARPTMYGATRNGVRKAIVTGFPYYVVYYHVMDDVLEVLSVFHTSRDPKIWKDRI